MNPRQRSIADGWIELESDPGLFTLLIEDYGVSGVEVEEVYDLQASIPGPVYGFIFLFKWLEGTRRSRRNPKFELSPGITVTDENMINSIFFAQQKVQNSCATHAILSILMNSKDISLGPTLTELKSFTIEMNSENKGIALNNVPKLVLAHNKHARPDACRDCEEESDKGSTGTGGGGSTSIGSTKWHETFHFASFLPIDNHLYEMDSLKPYPIDHGKIPDNMEWQQYFLQLLYDRIAATNANESHEIRYNLMALVPRKLDKLKDKLDLLKANCDLLALAMKSLVLAIDPDVFRRVFQMSSFTSRKKLRDSEILQAAQYVLLSESQSPTSSLNGDHQHASGNVRQQQQKLSTDCERESQPSTSRAPPPLTELPVENVAELDCMNNNAYAIACYLATYLVEDFEICVAPAKAINANQSSSCATSSSITADGTAKNSNGGGDTASPGVDVVELSTSAPVYPNLPPKNAFSPRKMVKLRFASPCSEMELLSLKELIRYFNLLTDEMSKINALIEEQSMKHRAYEIDDQRRAHDYDNFISTFFQMMVNCGFIMQNEVPKTNKRKKSTILSSSAIDQEQQQKLSSFVVNKRKAN